jgi:hypothetical protein
MRTSCKDLFKLSKDHGLISGEKNRQIFHDLFQFSFFQKIRRMVIFDTGVGREDNN